MRRGRTNVDPYRAELQPLAGDIAGVVVVMTKPAVRVLGAVMRVRQRWVGLRRGR
jgi:hypothetical protein